MEVGSRLGTVKEVEQRNKKDDISMFMRVPISCSHYPWTYWDCISLHSWAADY